MEIKHTIEILTKDIQDIENLVRNLNNYPSPPRIEIDLAMAKLRNVYELLAMISADIKSDMEEAAHLRGTVAEHSTPEEESPLQGKKPGEAPEGSPLQEEVREMKEITEEKVEIKEKEEEEQQPAEEVMQTRAEPPKDSPVPQASKEADTRGAQEVPVPEKFKEEIKKASIIAEKFAANKSINERIAPGNSKDISSKLTGEPIESIKRNIGINDRFLIIRELLNGDNEGYNQLVQQLDACTNFDQAHGLIEQSFPNKMEHEGVDLLVKLSRRRFLSRNV
jgi:hypothetical protein